MQDQAFLKKCTGTGSKLRGTEYGQACLYRQARDFLVSSLYIVKVEIITMQRKRYNNLIISKSP